MVAVTNLDVGNLDDIVILQDMPGNRSTIYQRAIGAALVFEDVVIAD